VLAARSICHPFDVINGAFLVASKNLMCATPPRRDDHVRSRAIVVIEIWSPPHARRHAIGLDARSHSEDFRLRGYLGIEVILELGFRDEVHCEIRFPDGPPIRRKSLK